MPKFNWYMSKPISNQVKQKKIVVKKIEWLEVSSHLANCKTDQEKEKINWTFFQGYCKNESDCWNLDYTENGGSFWGVRLWSGWRNICLVQFWSFLSRTPPISVPDATWPFWGVLADSQSLPLAKTVFFSSCFPFKLA